MPDPGGQRSGCARHAGRRTIALSGGVSLNKALRAAFETACHREGLTLATATPGLDFGHHLPRKHLRIAYTTRSERLLEAAERIRALGLGR